MNDGVTCNAQFVEYLEELADVHIVLDHSVGVLILPADTTQFRFNVCAEVHARATPPHKPGLVRLVHTLDKIDCGVGCFIIDGFHAFLGQRTGVLDFLSSVGLRPGTNNTSRAKFLNQCRVLEIILILRLFLGI